MNQTKLTTGIAEAKRFIEKVKALEVEREYYPDWSHPRESGAARRASMDLTRALADLRRAE